jgi:hypothetical protein
MNLSDMFLFCAPSLLRTVTLSLFPPLYLRIFDLPLSTLGPWDDPMTSRGALLARESCYSLVGRCSHCTQLRYLEKVILEHDPFALFRQGVQIFLKEYTLGYPFQPLSCCLSRSVGHYLFSHASNRLRTPT